MTFSKAVRLGAAWGAWFGFIAGGLVPFVGLPITDGWRWAALFLAALGSPLSAMFGTTYGAIIGAIAGPTVGPITRLFSNRQVGLIAAALVATAIATPMIVLMSWLVVDYTDLGGLFEESWLRYYLPCLAALIAARPFAKRLSRAT